jgi:hypothetical protein
MTHMIHIKSNRPFSTKLVLGIGLSAFLALGTIAGAAHAEDRYDRGDHHRGDRGQYYAAPPVIYGPSYYYPPPVVYGPGIGVVMPGLNVEIR